MSPSRRIRRGGAAWLLPILALALAWIEAGPAVPQDQSVEDSCGVCHSDEREAYRDSAHAATGLTCEDCHGGDPGEMEPAESMCEDAGFRKAPSRAEIPGFCASCHSDRERMRAYGIPVDQFEEYQTSRHGKRLAEGDEDVAVCTDCHGADRDPGRHEVRAVDDPQSTVFPSNLHTTCGRCHSDEALMGPHGLRTDQVELYTESVHGKALLMGGNEAAASCASCHGDHGALPPGLDHIGDVCGQCHGPIRDLVRESAHGEAAQGAAPAGGSTEPFSECVSCHGEGDGGAHGVDHPTAQLFGDTCMRCHAEEPEVLRLASDLEQVITRAETSLEAAQAEVERARDLGFVVSEWDSLLDEAQTELIQARLNQHKLTVNAVDQHSRVVESVREQIAEQLSERLNIARFRQFSVGPIWLFVLWTCGLLLLKRRRLEAQRQSHELPGPEVE